MKIIELIDGLEKRSGVLLDGEKTCDGFIYGDPNNELKKVVVTFMATVDVINQAIECGANLIITHEPTWYTGEDSTEWLQDNVIYKKKMKLVEDNEIVIYRFHDRMHMFKEGDMILRGFDEKFGWQKNRIIPDYCPEFGATYEIEPTILGDVLDIFHAKLEMDIIQFIGDMNKEVRRIGVYVGGGSLGLGIEEKPMLHMQRNKLDLIICGDITGWTTVPYINDGVSLNENVSMIVLGHERSEEMGMEFLAEYLKNEFMINEKVIFVDSREPFEYMNYA